MGWKAEDSQGGGNASTGENQLGAMTLKLQKGTGDKGAPFGEELEKCNWH